MDNSKFDELFRNARNSESKFRLLFTPLAQENIVNLLEEVPDYKIKKEGIINCVHSQILDSLTFNSNATAFSEYNIDEFIRVYNAKGLDVLKTIYFMLAPLLCVPLFQQYPFEFPEFEKTAKFSSEVCNQEILFNFFDKKALEHEKSTTNSIYRTSTIGYGKYDVCHLNVLSFAAQNCVERVETVNVEFVNYVPLTKDSFLINIPNTFLIYEHKISKENLLSLKHIFKDFEDAYISKNFISVLSSSPVEKIKDETLIKITKICSL